MELLGDCAEPAEPGAVLRLLKKGDTDEAALAYVRYVLDVRDSLQLCNGRLKEVRQYCINMKKTLEGENER